MYFFLPTLSCSLTFNLCPFPSVGLVSVQEMNPLAQAACERMSSPRMVNSQLLALKSCLSSSCNKGESIHPDGRANRTVPWKLEELSIPLRVCKIMGCMNFYELYRLDWVGIGYQYCESLKKLQCNAGNAKYL